MKAAVAAVIEAAMKNVNVAVMFLMGKSYNFVRVYPISVGFA